MASAAGPEHRCPVQLQNKSTEALTRCAPGRLPAREGTGLPQFSPSRERPQWPPPPAACSQAGCDLSDRPSARPCGRTGRWRWGGQVEGARPPSRVPPLIHSQNGCPEQSCQLPITWRVRPSHPPSSGSAGTRGPIKQRSGSARPGLELKTASCSHLPYLVMGTGVPSICQVLVNQGLLVLSSCLQEHVQAHGLQLGLGLGL